MTTAEKNAKEKKAETGSSSQQDSVSINDIVEVKGTSFHIRVNEPCPEYESFGTRAFRAKDTKTGQDLIALLTGDVVVPRFLYMPSLRGMRSPRMLSFHSSGIVKLPSNNKNYVACIFDVPRGQKIMREQNGKLYNRISTEYSQKNLNGQIIAPFLQLLQNLRKLDITHGAINLQNIYAIEDKDGLQLQLGECVTSPHSYTQSALFAPINRALAQPSSRGVCSEKDDLYAFGVCLVLMAIGNNPFEGLSEQEVITRKLEMGTYASMVRNSRLPSGISEFLRGVLNDEYSSRWALDEALKWLEGSRMTIKTPRPAYKSVRPYVFMDTKYSYITTLVNAFVQNPSYAIQVLKEKKFREWLHRNTTDKGTIANFDKNFGSDKDPVEAYNNHYDLMLAHACIALDPTAPVRYHNLSVIPRGFGMGLAHAVMHKEDVNLYMDILKKQIFNHWFDMQYVHLSDSGSLSMELEKCRSYLRQKMVGRGFERVLYTLCLEVHCLSPIVKHLYVRDAADLLDAFESLAADGSLPSLGNFFDRHIIAFLLEREPKTVEPYVSMIISDSKEYKLTGLIRCFSVIQQTFGGGPSPHLVKWFVSNIEPALKRIHDRKLRKSLLEQVKVLGGETQFHVLINLIDNVDVVRRDTRNFIIAQSEYMALEMERTVLKRKIKQGSLLGLAGGRQTAMVASVVLSMLSILVLFFGLY